MPFINGTGSRYEEPSPPLASMKGLNGGTIYSNVAGGEPIAVVGIALKFPQQATDPSAFWDLLTRGGTSHSEVPADRYNGEAFYRPKENGNKPGTAKTKHGHFIAEPLNCFDAPFFSITPHEAECMDPQQRWLLETSYHALENAGMSLDKVNGSNTSVYVGCFMNDHETMVHKDLEVPNSYHATGSASAILSNRLSWFYNLKGPSISVNTACSGSLVALHLACQSLRTGETEMGLVCGSNLLFAPESTIGLSNLNFLSPDGKCYSFDERANGYARGEGIACLVIKPVSAALRDGNTIRAIIRGTGVNSDGRTPGISQPSSDAQINLIRETYSRFGLELSKTRYFEAHGTGTQVGDPLEANSIATAFNQKQRGGQPMYVGAVKSNIGHLEGASGLAGVIKTILVLENASIPPNHGLNKVNPAIKNDWGLSFPTRQIPWPGEGVRRASVNSFGFGGTNAHIVLDDAESFLHEQNLTGNVQGQKTRLLGHGRLQSQTSKLLIWSSFDESGIKRQHDSLNIYFADRVSEAGEDAEYLEALSYTLSERRTHLPWRGFSICNEPQDLRNLEPSSAVRINPRLRVCLVFTGQGAQWPNMGKELLSYSTFRQSLEESDAILHEVGCQFSILEKLYSDDTKNGESDIDRPEFCQPLCTALQIALIELLSQWGVEPSAVIGHSSGEVAAAFCAGLISKAYALELAFFRGVAVAAMLQANPSHGGMMAVRLSPEKVEAVLSKHQIAKAEKLRIACYNSPQNLTLSGDRSEIDRLESLLEAEGIMAKRLNVGIAYHNEQHMQAAADLYRSLAQHSYQKQAESKRTRTLRCTFISSVRGTHLTSDSDATEVSNPEYWVDNLVCPVRFAEGMSHLSSIHGIEKAMTDTHFLEVGPHSTLKSAIKESLPKGWNVEKCYSSMLQRQYSAVLSSLTSAGRLHCLGYPIDVVAVNTPTPSTKPIQKTLVDLPQYPFDHSRQYWLEGRISQNNRFHKFPHHDFLGTPTADWNPLEAQWNNRITLEEKAFVKDHKVSGTYAYPAAGMLVMAIESTRQLGDPKLRPKGYRFKDVTFSRSIVVPENNHGVETQFRLRKDEDHSTPQTTWYDFRLHLYDHGEWVQCCRGSVAVEYQSLNSESLRQRTQEHLEISHSSRTSVAHDHFYTDLHKAGLGYGPLFQTVDQIRYGDDATGFGNVDLQKWAQLTKGGRPSECLVHPGALDCIIQIAFLGIAQGGQKDIPTLVPTAINEMWISADAPSRRGYDESVVQVSAKSFANGSRGHIVNYTSLWKEDERPFLVGDLTLTSIGNATPIVKKDDNPVSLYHVDWKPDVDLITWDFFAKQTDSPSMPVENVMLTAYVCYLAIMDVLDGIGHKNSLPVERPPHFQKHLDWMYHQLELIKASSNWKSFLSTQRRRGESREELYQKVDSFGREGKLIVRLARELLPIMLGEVDPLQLLFSPGDETLSDYYRLENPPPEVLAGIQKYVEFLGHANPHMRVLEIGGGTGGMTRGVLDVIGGTRGSGEVDGKDQQFSEYMFTDLSPSFFSAAKKNFGKGRDGFRCKTLNIEKDPKEQGFEIGSYDLIVASNVLHATPYLSTTLSNTRKLLKPDGKMLLVEGIAPNLMRTSFIFGLLHGWWLSTESYRQWGPLISAKQWDQVLRANDFTGTDLVIDGPDPDSCLASAIISSARQSQEPNGSTSSRNKLAIIRNEGSSLQSRLASSLQNVGRDLDLEVHVTDLRSLEAIEGATCVLLQTLDEFKFQEIMEKDFKSLKNLLRTAKQLLWVTQNNAVDANTLEQDAILGLARSVQSESDGLRIVTLGLENARDVKHVTQRVWTVLRKYFGVDSDIIPKSHGEEILEIEGSFCTSRMVPAKELENDIKATKKKQARFELDTVGNLDIGDDDIEIEAKAIYLHPQDLPHLSGNAGHSSFGSHAGIIAKVGKKAKNLFRVGDRAVAITQTGALKTKVLVSKYLAQKIVDELDFEEAVAAPLDFVAAYDALTNWAKLQKGESVLIHDGAGALGQALIQLAVDTGAEVFATVPESDIDSISALYRIPASHLFNPQNGDIASQIKKLTKRGVNVIISPSKSDGLQKIWDCVAPYGRVVEVGSRDAKTTGREVAPPLRSIKNNIIFASLDLTELFQDRERTAPILAMITKMVNDTRLAAARPLYVYSLQQFKDAFGRGDSEVPSGRVVVTLNDGFDLKTQQSLGLQPDATYLISGGLGGLGKSIAKWLVSQGARNLLLLSRQGGDSESSKPFVDALTASGVKVFAPKCDISNEKTVKDVLRQSQKRLPPIKGCIQASMVLKSAMFQTMSLDRWTDTLSSKVQASSNLHKHLSGELDFNIFLSSVCGIIGASGQSNYAFGCAYQDALARCYASLGKKAISIDLGIVEGVGYTAKHKEADKFMRALGMQPISEDYIHSLLAYYCDPSNKIKDPRDAQIVAGIMTQEEMRRKGVVRPKFFSRPLFRHLQRVVRTVEATPSPQAVFKPIPEPKDIEVEEEPKPQPSRSKGLSQSTMRDAICERLSNMLELTIEDIDSSKPMHAFGVDSLVAIELRSWFAEALKADVPVFDILSNLSIDALAEKAGGQK